MQDSVEDLLKFSIKLGGFALNNQSTESSVACVQSFVELPRFTERDFFSDNGISLLTSAVIATATLREESSYEPWRNVLPAGYEATVNDLKNAYDAVVVRQSVALDASEIWRDLRSVKSSDIGEPSCWTGE